MNRRRLVQGLLLAGPAFGAQAAAASRLEFGLADAPGTGSHALAQECARRLLRQLSRHGGEPATAAVSNLPPGADARAWCAAAPGLKRVVLATAWRSALGDEASCVAASTAKPALGLVPLGVLARAPLVLMTGRSAPIGWPAVQRAALSSTAPWRCGIDGSDPAAAASCTLLLRALGLAQVETVPFRGPAHLLPALVGDRLPLAALTVGQYIGERWHALSADEAAGNLGSAVAAHRRAEVQLLTVADRRRLPGLPGVPTLDEWRGCPGNDIGRCLLLLAPADLDIDVVKRLAEAVAAIRQLTTS